MATSSFDKGFVVTDIKTTQKVQKQLASRNNVKVAQKDVKAESSKGVQLLKRSL